MSRSYEDTEDAAEDLRTRGIEVVPTRANSGPSTEEKVCNAFSWQGPLLAMSLSICGYGEGQRATNGNSSPTQTAGI